MSAQDVWPSFAGMWCGVEGPWTDETAQAHFDACEDCQTERAAFIEAQQVEHTGWCNDHRTWVDPINHRDVTEVCRRVVTVGEATVELEVSPSWTEPADLPIVMPDWTACDQAGARDLAAALIEAARVLEGAR